MKERFDHRFCHVAWIPENKEQILSFIQEETEKAREEGRERLKAVRRDFVARWEHPDSRLPLEHSVKSETLYHLDHLLSPTEDNQTKA